MDTTIGSVFLSTEKDVRKLTEDNDHLDKEIRIEIDRSKVIKDQIHDEDSEYGTLIKEMTEIKKVTIETQSHVNTRISNNELLKKNKQQLNDTITSLKTKLKQEKDVHESSIRELNDYAQHYGHIWNEYRECYKRIDKPLGEIYSMKSHVLEQLKLNIKERELEVKHMQKEVFKLKCQTKLNKNREYNHQKDDNHDHGEEIIGTSSHASGAGGDTFTYDNIIENGFTEVTSP